MNHPWRISLKMAKKILLLFVLIICLYSLSPAADPFYTNLLNEGKALYLDGKYDEALEDFKIAEFGLIDEKEIVPELFFYYALTQYKKGQVGESQALLDKMKLALGGADLHKLAKPKEIESELSIMVRALDYLKQPGAKPGFLPFFNLFYETWDLLKAKKLPEAEAKLKIMGKMNGDENRLRFLEGFLAFQKGEHKKCVSRLEKVAANLGEELGEDAQFYLAYCMLKRGDLVSGEKYAAKIKNPDYVHQLMLLIEELKATNQEKRKK
jgi:tetratricopeptide (TPR) repeat protein